MNGEYINLDSTFSGRPAYGSRDVVEEIAKGSAEYRYLEEALVRGADLGPSDYRRMYELGIIGENPEIEPRGGK